VIHTVTAAPDEWQRNRSAIRHAARKAARAAGASVYSICDAAGAELWRCPLPPLKPKPAPKPRSAARITPEAVEAAYREHGAAAPAVLGCTKQLVSGNPLLRAARDRAYAARGEVVPRGTGRPPRAGATVLRLYLTPPEVVALEARAHAAGMTREEQIALDVEAWLASPGEVPPQPEAGTSYAVRALPDILGCVEAAVGVPLRTRAIEAAVRRGNAAVDAA
jgi:hypothetical protein